MTWTLHSDGVNDFVSVGSTLNISDDSIVEFKFGNGNDDILSWGTSETEHRVWGVNSNNTVNYGKVTSALNRIRIRAFGTNSEFDWTDAGHSFVDAHVYEIVRDGVDMVLSVDGSPVVTLFGDDREIRMSMIMGNIGGAFTSFDLWYLNIADAGIPANDRQFNSDSSGGTGNVLPNDIGTDGTLNNFPGDDSQWVDVSSGISITGATTNYSYTAQDSTIELAGEIVVEGTATNYSYTSQDSVIDLTGEIIVPGTTTNYSYTQQNANISLTATISIDGSSTNYSYTAQNADIELTGAIQIEGSTTNYTYDAEAIDIVLQGQIAIQGSTTNYAYNILNGTIILQGPITLNPRNVIRVARKSNTIIVKRKSNIVRVR